MIDVIKALFFVLIVCIVLAIPFLWWGTIIYVAAHFISKLW